MLLIFTTSDGGMIKSGEGSFLLITDNPCGGNLRDWSHWTCQCSHRHQGQYPLMDLHFPFLWTSQKHSEFMLVLSD